MPTYEHICESCNHEWEDEYSIKSEPPKNCPSCNQETVKRLISGGDNRRGKVELTGQDLIDKIKGDAQVLKRDAAQKEKIYAHLLGEDRYQSLQTRIDNQKRNR